MSALSMLKKVKFSMYHITSGPEVQKIFQIRTV